MNRSWLASVALIVTLGGWACGGATSGASDVSAPEDTAPADTLAAADAVGDADTAAAGEDTVAPDAAADVDADDAAVDAAGPEDPSARLFPTDRVLAVAITLAPADFAQLRGQTRTLFDILDAVCDDLAVPDPFTWFRASVTVDGVTVDDVGVRKKGFLGSLDAIRPALKLKLDEFVPGQRLAGLDRITLNNGRQDASRLRTCLAYDVFRAAGVPTPRCAFAHVTVNGEDLGLYAHVESMKKDFVRRWFPEPLGELYEGNVSDFRDGWTGTFERKYDEDLPASGIIAAVTAAAAVPDDHLVAALDAVVDLDAFFTFWATEVVVSQWDGYTNNRNNFLVYADPRDGRLRFIPWGPDGAFMANPSAQADAPLSVFANGLLAHRLYAIPAGRARYQAALADVLAHAFDATALTSELDRLDALTASARVPSTVAAAATEVAAVRAFINGRHAALQAELATPPEWPYPIGDRPCLVDHGHISGSFATTWGTIDQDNLFATGTASLAFATDFFTGTLPPPGGSKAGPDPDIADAARIQLAVGIQPNVYIVIDIQLPRALVAPGAVDTEAPGVQVLAYRFEAGGAVQLLGYLRGGGLVFGADTLTVDGTPVDATFDLRFLTF